MSPATLRNVILLGALAQLVFAKDPLDDFCRRWGHQTTVIDRKLYIDGGQVTWNPMSQNPLNYTNTWLSYQNLDVLNQGMPQLAANLSKNSTVPDLSGGVLWGDDVNKVFYLFGGEYVDGASPENFQPWAYDVLLNQWNQTSSSAANGIQRVSYGAGATVNQTGIGYYLGGWLNNNTVPGWDAPPLLTSNLISYNMVEDTWTNGTGPDTTGRAEGVMVYIPASDHGLLVYFGGIMDPYQNGTVVGSEMSKIYIYDIASTKWYTQTATGDVPDMRRKFCAGATWAQDQSSYNIYLYGGLGVNNGSAAFDDVYILSLPSFIWIKWYPTTTGPGSPHGILSCNVIENSQMLIIGGWFPDSQDCDAPTIWGTHNLNLGEDGSQNAKWDLFEPNITKYLVPPEIIAAIGGTPTGGATVKSPASWDNRDLPIYFTRIPSYSARAATRSVPTTTSTSKSSGSSSSSSTDVGAIVGGVVGGVAGLIIILLLVWFCLRRRRKQKGQKEGSRTASELPTNAPAELASAPSVREPKSGSVGENTITPVQTYTSGHTVSPQSLSPGVPFPGSPASPYNTMQSGQNPQGYAPQPVGGYPSTVSPQWPAYPPGPAPYDPSQHALHQEHFQPPPLPRTGASNLAPPGNGESVIPTPSDYSRGSDSTSNTPAHFYPQPLQVAQQRQTSGGTQGSQETPLVGRISESVGSLKSPVPLRGRFREEG